MKSKFIVTMVVLLLGIMAGCSANSLVQGSQNNSNSPTIPENSPTILESLSTILESLPTIIESSPTIPESSPSNTEQTSSNGVGSNIAQATDKSSMEDISDKRRLISETNTIKETSKIQILAAAFGIIGSSSQNNSNASPELGTNNGAVQQNTSSSTSTLAALAQSEFMQNNDEKKGKEDFVSTGVLPAEFDLSLILRLIGGRNDRGDIVSSYNAFIQSIQGTLTGKSKEEQSKILFKEGKSYLLQFFQSAQTSLQNEKSLQKNVDMTKVNNFSLKVDMILNALNNNDITSYMKNVNDLPNIVGVGPVSESNPSGAPEDTSPKAPKAPEDTSPKKTQIFHSPLVVYLDDASYAKKLSGDFIPFDFDSNGNNESMPFVAKGAGFLALDVNQDGKITNGNELFGPKTDDGFAELAIYDLNKDNIIDSKDYIYNQLLIWTKDSDNKDILKSLYNCGIKSINIKNVNYFQRGQFDIFSKDFQLGYVLSRSNIVWNNEKSGFIEDLMLRIIGSVT